MSDFLILLIPSIILFIAIVILYLIYILEKKGILQTKFRRIFIFVWVLLPSFTDALSIVFNSPELRSIFFRNFLFVLVFFPLHLLTFTLTAFLDRQLSALIYHKTVFYLSNMLEFTQFWPWMLLGISFCIGLVVNIFMNQINGKSIARHT